MVAGREMTQVRENQQQRWENAKEKTQGTDAEVKCEQESPTHDEERQ